jgi:hypothetical protein
MKFPAPLSDKKNEFGEDAMIRVSRMRVLLTLTVLLVAAVPTGGVLAQVLLGYDFITFQAGYDRIAGAARNDGYQIKEEEITSAYGSYHLLLEKSGQFYGEEISLFFNQERELIYFSASFIFLENQPRTIVRKLITSIASKLEEKYGESQRDAVPYFRVYENEYEILVYPPTPTSESARVSFKHLDRYAAYLEFYREEVERLVDQEIEQTMQNL